ncbi:MAG TPA: cupin domain-containing protein [Usitatibacter sp.]|nr:cupin domain-containing protein [Usitatibacter sp.]
MTRKRLGALDVDAFMRRCWQRKPLLVRGAFAGFVDPLSPAQVLAAATREETNSRLVVRTGKKWSLEHGPIAASRLRGLPRRDWTVLVQDTNHFAPRADALLRAFDFIPHARIDDVMVSYATPGGGVGPHVDSYDVFLLQGHGRRRWRISSQADHEFVPGLPLRILRRFQAQEEWVLEAGDMLYLPPGVAHEGAAETECLTWSIGFRAPSDAEVVHGFLDHLRDRLAPAGHYADPGAQRSRNPGAVPGALVSHIDKALRTIRWSAADVREFAGCFLSEPKAEVVFEPPRPALPRARFASRIARHGIALDARSRLLFSGTMFFINGERVAVTPAARAMARSLADRRALMGPLRAGDDFVELAYAWYRQGFVVPGREGP